MQEHKTLFSQTNEKYKLFSTEEKLRKQNAIDEDGKPSVVAGTQQYYEQAEKIFGELTQKINKKEENPKDYERKLAAAYYTATMFIDTGTLKQENKERLKKHFFDALVNLKDKDESQEFPNSKTALNKTQLEILTKNIQKIAEQEIKQAITNKMSKPQQEEHIKRSARESIALLQFFIKYGEDKHKHLVMQGPALPPDTAEGRRICIPTLAPEGNALDERTSGYRVYKFQTITQGIQMLSEMNGEEAPYFSIDAHGNQETMLFYSLEQLQNPNLANDQQKSREVYYKMLFPAFEYPKENKKPMMLEILSCKIDIKNKVYDYQSHNIITLTHNSKKHYALKSLYQYHHQYDEAIQDQKPLNAEERFCTSVLGSIATGAPTSIILGKNHLTKLTINEEAQHAVKKDERLYKVSKIKQLTNKPLPNNEPEQKQRGEVILAEGRDKDKSYYKVKGSLKLRDLTTKLKPIKEDKQNPEICNLIRDKVTDMAWIMEQADFSKANEIGQKINKALEERNKVNPKYYNVSVAVFDTIQREILEFKNDPQNREDLIKVLTQSDLYPTEKVKDLEAFLNAIGKSKREYVPLPPIPEILQALVIGLDKKTLEDENLETLFTIDFTLFFCIPNLEKDTIQNAVKSLVPLPKEKRDCLISSDAQNLMFQNPALYNLIASDIAQDFGVYDLEKIVKIAKEENNLKQFQEINGLKDTFKKQNMYVPLKTLLDLTSESALNLKKQNEELYERLCNRPLFHQMINTLSSPKALAFEKNHSKQYAQFFHAAPDTMTPSLIKKLTSDNASKFCDKYPEYFDWLIHLEEDKAAILISDNTLKFAEQNPEQYQELILFAHQLDTQDIKEILSKDPKNLQTDSLVETVMKKQKPNEIEETKGYFKQLLQNKASTVQSGLTSKEFMRNINKIEEEIKDPQKIKALISPDALRFPLYHYKTLIENAPKLSLDAIKLLTSKEVLDIEQNDMKPHHLITQATNKPLEEIKEKIQNTKQDVEKQKEVNLEKQKEMKAIEKENLLKK